MEVNTDGLHIYGNAGRLNISFQYRTSIFSVYHSSGLRPATPPSPGQPSTILN